MSFVAVALCWSIIARIDLGSKKNKEKLEMGGGGFKVFKEKIFKIMGGGKISP